MLRNEDKLPHGMMHIGQGLVCGDKIQDLIKAGFSFTIFLADYHSMINNKYGGDLQKIRTTGEYFQHAFTSLGIDKQRVEYVWASDIADKKEYWEKVLRIARTITTQRVMRAIPIMGRDMKAKETEAAAIFYPCMQAADIFEMQLDVACAGIDQRKAHILAREAGEKLGWGKPVSIHTPILMGLHGVPNASAESFDEDPKLNQVIAAKMSKSKPDDNILIHDEPDVIQRKIQQAYCPARIADGNPILEYFRTLVFRDHPKITIEREAKFGGDVEVQSYKQLENGFTSGEIHPKDLKTSISRILSSRLAPVREYFKNHPQSLEKMRKLGSA
ncbi:tyrosine--tRNA ligase [Candidatus Bathyarchaeota archaeon]|nr:tyrosine--tRNA ligase [Candidatus Bathyarchaeota archaeon]